MKNICMYKALMHKRQSYPITALKVTIIMVKFMTHSHYTKAFKGLAVILYKKMKSALNVNHRHQFILYKN